jgi:hypothetical protein
MRFSDWTYARTGKTHEIALERLFGLTHDFLVEELGVERSIAVQALQDDYEASGARGRLPFLEERARRENVTATTRGRLRQMRHLAER